MPVIFEIEQLNFQVFYIHLPAWNGWDPSEVSHESSSCPLAEKPAV